MIARRHGRPLNHSELSWKSSPSLSLTSLVSLPLPIWKECACVQNWREKSLTPHPRTQRPRFFWSALRIAASGQVQRHSSFEWLCKPHNSLRPEPIRFAIIVSEHAQKDGKAVNRGLQLLDQARGRDSWSADHKERGLWGRECLTPLLTTSLV